MLSIIERERSVLPLVDGILLIIERERGVPHLVEGDALDH